MVKVQVGPRKVVYVEGDRDKDGVYCSFYGDNTHDFPLGNKYVHAPKGASQQTINLAMVGAAKDYFSR